MAISGSRQKLEKDLAAVENLLTRLTHIESRFPKPDETQNPNLAPELVEERQSSSQGAGKSDPAFTKERSAVGARMTVASSSSDVRKRDAEEGSSAGASKRPKLSYDEHENNNNTEALNPDSGGEGVGSMSTLHSGEETSSRRDDEYDRYKSSWSKCLKILDELKGTFVDAWVFCKPVLEIWPDLVTYQQVIRNPMDLGTARSRVERRLYSNPAQFAADVRLTFDNAMNYNQVGSVYHTMAKRLLLKFNNSFAPVERMLKSTKPSKVKYQPIPVAPVVVPVVAAPVNPAVKPESPVIRRVLPVKPALKPESPANRRVAPPPPPPAPPVTETSPVRSVKWDPEPVKTHTPRQHHHHHHHHQDHHQGRKSGKLNPRLGRQTNLTAYGGQRALSLKEKSKLKVLVESFPIDRMNKVRQILREKMPGYAEGVELDLDHLDERTLFDIYRLAMNWQKSKNKVKKLQMRNEDVELDSGSQLQMPGDSSDDVDIDGDLPDSPQEQHQEQVQSERKEVDEKEKPGKEEDSSSDSEGESSDDSDTSSSDSDSGSDSSDNESDGEKKNDSGGESDDD